MDWDTLILILFLNILPIQANHELNLNRFMNFLQRRNFRTSHPVLGIPRYPEDLPAAEPMLPGHTLLRPTSNMLKSAAKYPLRDLQNSLVYGNLGNLGITDAKGRRIKYTDFRKTNDILGQYSKIIRNALKKYNHVPVSKQADKKLIVVIINANPLTLDEKFIHHEIQTKQSFRRRLKRSKSKHRHRKQIYSDSDTTDSSGSSDYEKNPGNPYTLHKSKYKQNWMWNHIMDGDHINVNPYAPNTPDMGPSGIDLFFSRKWWYYNQDDYKPMA